MMSTLFRDETACDILLLVSNGLNSPTDTYEPTRLQMSYYA